MSESKTSKACCIIELDAERCSYCGFCVRHCPAQAFRIEQREGQIFLFFDAGKGAGCTYDESCASVCPEEAIRLVSSAKDVGPAAETLLAQSELLACTYCGELFAPLGKLLALSREGRARREPIRELCPLCRRKHLVVKFIEEKRLPGVKAAYRSGTDIQRQAGHGPKDE